MGRIWNSWELVAVVIGAMGGIYRTSLYRFAVDGRAPVAFAGANLAGAFGPRRGNDRR